MNTEQQIIMKVSLPKELTTIVKIEEGELPAFVKCALAVELFREKKISLGKAAQIAGLSKEEMLALLAVKKIPIHYTVEELREDAAS